MTALERTSFFAKRIGLTVFSIVATPLLCEIVLSADALDHPIDPNLSAAGHEFSADTARDHARRGGTGAGDRPVLVEGGTFLMGTDAGAVPGLEERYGIDWPQAFRNEVPAHRVTVSDFRMDRREVTNARFAAFVAENPGWRPDRLPAERQNGAYLEHWRDGTYPKGEGDRPVVNVTWHAAQAFCHWAGGRLPTEAEWEYAARCGDDREFPWGDELPSPERANYYESGHRATVAGGSYPPNDCGLQDLAGSVWELLADSWEPEYPEAARIDPCPRCPETREEMLRVEGRRAVRGGSFDGSVVNLRTRWRDSHVVTNAIGFVGFRCAYPVSPES